MNFLSTEHYQTCSIFMLYKALYLRSTMSHSFIKDGAWLLQMSVKTAVALQLLQTKYWFNSQWAGQDECLLHWLWRQFCQRNVVQFSKDVFVLESFWLAAAELLVGPGFRVRTEFGIKFVKIFSANIGPAYKFFLQTTVKQSSWSNLEWKWLA